MDVHQTVKSSKPRKYPIDSTEDVFLALRILCHTHQHLPKEHLSNMLNYSLSRQSTVQIVLRQKKEYSVIKNNDMHRVDCLPANGCSCNRFAGSFPRQGCNKVPRSHEEHRYQTCGAPRMLSSSSAQQPSFCFSRIRHSSLYFWKAMVSQFVDRSWPYIRTYLVETQEQ